jgi:hypothetical protein
MAAPDYVAPIVRWRGWFVVEAAGALRLCSIVYHTLWPPRQELVASCRSREYRLKPELPAKHTAPEAACRCGIYACESAAGATPFLSCSRTPARQTLGLVLGRLSLWGKVVECQRGWRGERAYPASIYVPLLSARGRFLLACSPGAETVASRSAATACRSSRSRASRWPSSRARSGASMCKRERRLLARLA